MIFFNQKTLILFISFLVIFLPLNLNASIATSGKKYDRNRIIGTVADFMPRTGSNIGPGPLVADAILSETEYTGVQVALISGLEIRSDLIPGPVTFNTIRKLVLNTKIVTFELQVHELKKLIERIVLWQSRKSHEFARIHVSGIRFSLDINAEPDQMVTDIDIGSLSSGYRFSDSSEIVRIASTAYILNDLASIKGRQFLWEVNPAHITLQKTVEQYLYTLRGPVTSSPENRVNTVHARIKVFSDPHYFDPSLLINNGAAFTVYGTQSARIMAESKAVLLSTVSFIRASRPDICIIPGDLTNNGEFLSHTGFTQILTDSLLSADIKVYTTPGNHDINNTNAFCYDGNTTIPVKTIDKEDFEELYENFGYGDAIEQDPSSLSYIAQPQNGLWILSIDACTFAQEQSFSHTEGAFPENTLKWIIGKLDFAQKHNIKVIGLMHHNITEHFAGQAQVMSKLFNDNTVNTLKPIRDMLAVHGLKIIFTGHNHIQEIVKHTTENGNFVFEIASGSISSWPSPLRTVTLTPYDQLETSTTFINNIECELQQPSFQQFTKERLTHYFTSLATHILSSRFNFDLQQQNSLLPLLTPAFMAHIAGDESPSIDDKTNFKQLMTDSDPVYSSIGATLQSLWTDLSPSDNACTIDLIGGSSW